MGFCRRCGDIVAGTRCKCGGTAVAPVVPWSQNKSYDEPQDKWSKTYVSRDWPPTRAPGGSLSQTTHMTGTINSTSSSGSLSPTKRFPQPILSTNTTAPRIGSRVSAHIASTTSHSNRPPSPLKHFTTTAAPEADILPSLHDSTLSKVYGSVLQPKESLTMHSCAICCTPFLPDATIYHDPSATGSTPARFLCRLCFTTNGGSKGTCPTCQRPVLALKSEGGFIHAIDKYWHRRCFNCEGCHKNIGHSPMVDLLGRPSCAECFEDCLKRDATPKKRLTNESPRLDRSIGGMNPNSQGARSREGSPTIDELEQRLGIATKREASPQLEELSQRLSLIGNDVVRGYSVSGSSPVASPRTSKQCTNNRESSPLIDRARGRRGSRPEGSPSPTRLAQQLKSPDHQQGNCEAKSTLPIHPSGTSSPVRFETIESSCPTDVAIEEMKQRFMKGSPCSPATKAPAAADIPPKPEIIRPRLSHSFTTLRTAYRESSPPNEPLSPRSPNIPPTPDLMSDFSDTTTQSSSSGPESPPRNAAYDGDDVFNASKVYGRGYGSRYTRGDFLEGSDDVIVEETSSQLNTPTRTPKLGNASSSSKSTPLHTPSKPFSNLMASIPPLLIKKSPARKPPGIDLSTISKDHLATSSSCAKCQGALFSVEGAGKYVTIPADGENAKLSTYHTECFRCSVCGGVFKEAEKGKAIFVKASRGPCHVECAPPEGVNLRKSRSSTSLSTPSPSRPAHSPSTTSITASPSTSSGTYITSSRYDRPPQTAPPASASTSFPRFGSRTACPGCRKSVSPMEFGVVPGPHGTRWHSSCLVCGGKKEPARAWIRGSNERKKGEPGCGKKLDSAAKSDGEGGVWCRECLLLLPSWDSPQASPTRGSLVSSHNGASMSSKVAPQLTGTTTLARQFTGLGGGDASLLRQLTGGGSSPTRSLSPTKQLGMMGGGMRPRPKSVIGMRNTKSVDEGRGMFLVRQLTGATSDGWGD